MYDKLIEVAHPPAERTTLHEQFLRWLNDYMSGEQQEQKAMIVIQELRGKLRVAANSSQAPSEQYFC